MYLFSFFKLEGRRSCKYRRNTENTKLSSPERRSSTDRRTINDRRSYSERRTGIHHVLTEQEKLQLERMYDFLQKERLG